MLFNGQVKVRACSGLCFYSGIFCVPCVRCVFTDGVGRRRKAHGLLLNYDRMPAWLRRLHAPDWGVVAAAATPRGERKTLGPHPIGTKMEAGGFHWLWRCMTSTIKINGWDICMETGRDCTCQGPYATVAWRASLVPAHFATCKFLRSIQQLALPFLPSLCCIHPAG